MRRATSSFCLSDLPSWFNAIVEVLQGSVLSPLMFNIFIEVIIALNDTDVGAVLSGELPYDLRFADDIVLLSEDVGLCGYQVMAAATSMGCALTKLKLKSSILQRETKNSDLVDGQQIQQSDNFIYLGENVNAFAGD